MKLAALAVVAAALCRVQALNATTPLQLVFVLPKCAQTCLVPMLYAANCSVTAFPEFAACLCPNQALQRNATTCLRKTCTVDEQFVVSEMESEICVDHPLPSRAKELQLVCIVLLSLALLVVVLRLCSRMVVSSRLWWDDAMLLIASLTLFGMLSSGIWATVMGVGKHIWLVNPYYAEGLEKLFYIIQILYIIVQVFTKLSLLAFYLRVFPQRWFRLTTLSCLVFMGLHGAIYLFIIIFQCTPIRGIWDMTVDKTCVSLSTITFTGAGFSILEDVVIIDLPIPCIKALKVGRGKRAGLFVMFSIGSLACVTSAVRLYYSLGFGYTDDQSWDSVDAIIWSAIEITVAVICASLPALRPLFVCIWPRLFGNATSARGSNDQPSLKNSMPTSDRARLADTDRAMSPELRNGSPASLASPQVFHAWRTSTYGTSDAEMTTLHVIHEGKT